MLYFKAQTSRFFRLLRRLKVRQGDESRPDEAPERQVLNLPPTSRTR
jgi:hypothetical protein